MPTSIAKNVKVDSGLKFHYKKIEGFFKRGTSPHDLALTLTLGFLIGTVPMLGVSTIISTLIALRWRLNLPIIIAITYILFPLQLALIIPFFNFAQFVFNLHNSFTSINLIIENFNQNWILALSHLGWINFLAVIVWLMMSLVLGWFIYIGIYKIIKIWIKK